MQYTITGDNLQMVTLSLAEGEEIAAEAGAMVNMSGNMQMTSTVTGGLLKGLKRMVTGESFFLSHFIPAGGSGQVAFAGNVPGKIVPISLNGNEFIAQQDAYLCAEMSVDLDIAFTKRIRAGLFGGEGFVMQKLSGHGTAFLHCCGDIIEMTLAPDQVMKVQTGLVVGFAGAREGGAPVDGRCKTCTGSLSISAPSRIGITLTGEGYTGTPQPFIMITDPPGTLKQSPVEKRRIPAYEGKISSFFATSRKSN